MYMLVDRSRIRYTVGWSFHCVMKLYKKKGSMINDSAIVIIMKKKVNQRNAWKDKQIQKNV
jgi:hypothetical protein